MTTRKPTPPPPPRPNQVVQAKPIAPPDKKQVDLETIAYEVREIRLLMEHSIQRTHASAWTYMIFGVLMMLFGGISYQAGGGGLAALGVLVFVLGVGLQTK